LKRRNLFGYIHTWEDNIKMSLKDIGRERVNWVQMIHMDQWQALVNTVMNIQVP
jgi:hypothetical protein